MTSESGLGRLLETGVVRTCPPDPRVAGNLLNRALLDLKTAERNLAEDPECAFTYSYTAMMRSGLAHMLCRGFRPASSNKHQIIVSYVLVVLNAKNRKVFESFDLLRNKRNRLIYEPDLPCSQKEAETALETAKRFVCLMSELIDGTSGQHKLNYPEKS